MESRAVPSETTAYPKAETFEIPHFGLSGVATTAEISGVGPPPARRGRGRAPSDALAPATTTRSCSST